MLAEQDMPPPTAIEGQKRQKNPRGLRSGAGRETEVCRRREEKGSPELGTQVSSRGVRDPSQMRLCFVPPPAACVTVKTEGLTSR